MRQKVPGRSGIDHITLWLECRKEEEAAEDLSGEGKAERLEQCYLVCGLQPLLAHEQFVTSHKETDTEN